MKRLSYFLFLLLLILSLSGCKNKTNEVVSRGWRGYLLSAGGEKTSVTINFTGKEELEGKNKTLKAGNLTITGGNFTKDIEFNSPDGEKSSNFWVFITKSANPSYPYGIVSISQDYKNINGQIPDMQVVNSFYSEEPEAGAF